MMRILVDRKGVANIAAATAPIGIGLLSQSISATVGGQNTLEK